MCIDGFHHVPYLTAFLSNEDDAGVFEALAFDEREEVVVERQENPVVLDGVRQLVPVGVAKRAFISGRMNSPAAAT
jgi:hypothetical protein